MLLGGLRLASLTLALLAVRCAADEADDDPNLGSTGARPAYSAQVGSTSQAPRASKIKGAPAAAYGRSAPLAFDYANNKVRRGERRRRNRRRSVGCFGLLALHPLSLPLTHSFAVMSYGMHRRPVFTEPRLTRSGVRRRHRRLALSVLIAHSVR